jgi:hypothetical protein
MRKIQQQFDEIMDNIHNNPNKTYQIWIKQLKRLVRACEISIVLLLLLLITEITLLSLGYISLSIIPIILIPVLIYQIRRLWKLGNFIECHYEFIKCLFSEIDKEGVM